MPAGEMPEEETEETRGDECTPPFTLFYAGARHEVAVCFEVVGDEAGLCLLLDGEVIDIGSEGGQSPPLETQGEEPALP
ncbi:MAG TPA: hypothetical protein VFN89_05735 [Solirubrobacterales bacterium]|nr:hypothetical protein [Solirubrobacterales bacterium]